MDSFVFVLPGVGISAENRGGVIGRRVENGGGGGGGGGILSPEAVASGEREISTSGMNFLASAIIFDTGILLQLGIGPS